MRELARLLCHGGTGEPRYVQGEMHEVLVPVAKLAPGGAATPTPDARRSRPRGGSPEHRAAFTRHDNPFPAKPLQKRERVISVSR